jgi:repressor LexA
MKIQITERQQEILTFIQQYKDENGFPPTLREIGKQFGISSTFGVKRHLDALVKKGYLNIESNSSRAISFVKNMSVDKEVVLERNDLFTKIPVIGRVAAGTPITAIENIEGSIVIDSSFIKKAQDSFALKVKGDSMINAGIFEGDVVIVSPTAEAFNGQTVVAMIDDEVTVKVFQKKNNKILLIPENDKYQPIEVEKTKDFKLVGKVVGLVRRIN